MKSLMFSKNMASLTGASTLVLALLTVPVMAQVESATGTADPSRVEGQIQQPDLAPQVSPQTEIQDLRAINAPAGAENIHFVLNDINVEGASAYTPDDLRSVYTGQVGQTISLADVYDIANKMTLKYRNAGYILTQVVVPQQTIDDGNVTLQVVEGFVSNVSVRKQDESAPINTALIESYAAGIKTGGPLNARDLERQLLLINDLPGVNARSILSPSATPGGADLLIVLDYDPIDGLISADNFGSRYLGPVQLGAAATLNSFLGQNEAISGQVVMAPQSWYELAYGAVSYEMPVGPYGTKVRLSGSITDTEPGYDLKEFDVEGRAYLLNVGVTHPFIRSRSENLYGRLNFDWRRVESENNIEPTRKDRLSVLRAGSRYQFMDTIFSAGANTVDLELSKGLGILGASDEGDANMTRANGDPQFTKLEGEVQRLQRITGSVNLLVAARGQISSNALLSSEEFGVGGFGFGRGYDPSEITGDEGVAAKVELQWQNPVSLESSFVENYQLYGFYDVGRVWNDDATAAAQKRDSLASAGAGVRFDLNYDMEGGFAVAVPLTREVATQGDHDPKFYLNLSKRF